MTEDESLTGVKNSPKSLATRASSPSSRPLAAASCGFITRCGRPRCGCMLMRPGIVLGVTRPRVCRGGGDPPARRQEPVVVYVELGAAGERGVREPLLDVPAEGGERLVRLDIGSLPEGVGCDSEAGEA